ncbi:hypothetical protein C8246_05895 [Paracidovorax avenae]|nr:hypothetical protein C8246_05895 [Paracidovorax avenae]
MKLPWFRVYTEMVDNETLKLVAFEDRWHFIALLCLKGQGLLDKDEAPALKLRKVAVKMGLDLRTLEEVARRLDEVGLIDRETLQPRNWDDRQMRSDADTTAAERKRRQRQREKATSAAPASDVTEASRVTPVTVTRTDTDTDTEGEEEKEPAVEQEGEAARAAPGAAPAAPPAPAKRAPAASRLPADWTLPEDWAAWAEQERPDLGAEGVRREGDCFADYWHAKAGADARKADWLATWRNWVRRAGVAPGAMTRTAPRGPGPDVPTETYAQRAARQRMEEVAPMAARKAPGGGGFAAAQRFMAGDPGVIDVPARAAAPRLAGGAR